MFKRKIYEQMCEWKRSSQGRSALLVEGARRVGKSTVVTAFAKAEYRSFILIDFSVVSPSIRNLFDDMSDLNFFFLQLQLFFHVDLYERDSLIVFDEVQLCPRARQAIKSLVKDHRYDYIETGSLLSLQKNVKDILIPSEEHKICMYPMDYEEFCWAVGDTVSASLIQECFLHQKGLGDDMNRRLMRNFRLYMLVGGMPQAVDSYLTTNNFRYVDEVKRDILQLYHDDFMKIDSSGKLSLLFDAIPAQLNSNASRYQVSSVLKNGRAGFVLEEVAQMQDSGAVLVSYHVNDPSIALSSQIDVNRFKLFMSDTGLFVTQMFRGRSFTDNVVYEKLLGDRLPVNLGYLYEQVVAQTLKARGYGLFYHTFKDPDSGHLHEVDFLLARGNKICPIEVKSSSYRAHSSLDLFSKKYSKHIASTYLIYTKDFAREGDVTYVPFYMAQWL